MATDPDLIKRCVAVHKVSKNLRVDVLKEKIKGCLDSVEIVRHLEVQGAESDQTETRWVLELSTPEGAENLIKNYMQAELEGPDGYCTIEYHEPVECEITEWLQEAHIQPPVPSKPSGHYLQQNQGIPLLSGYYQNIPWPGAGMEQHPQGPPEGNPVQHYGVHGNMPQQSWFTHQGQFGAHGMSAGYFGGNPRFPNPQMPHLDQYQGQMGDQQAGGQQQLQEPMTVMHPQYGPCLFDLNKGQYLPLGYPPQQGGFQASDGQVLPTSDQAYMPNQQVPPTSAPGFMPGQPISQSPYNDESPETETKEVEPTEERIQEDQEERLTRIVVKNLPVHADEEVVQMFFENKRKFGQALTVSNVKFDKEMKTAVVEFENADAVGIVLQKLPLKMQNQTIEVEGFKEAKNDPGTIEIASSTVMVENLPEDTDEDTIIMFFENKRKFGTTKVANIDLMPEEGRAVVTFENEEDVATVLSNRPLKLMGCEISVERLSNITQEQSDDIPSDEDDVAEIEYDGTQTTLLVSGLPDIADEEYIVMFFENKRRFGEINVSFIDLYPEYACALITFHKPEDLKKVWDKRPIEMQKSSLTLQIYVPAVLNTIVVTGPATLICEKFVDDLEIYFSHKKSGGEDIKNIVCKDDVNAVYVTYEEEDVAKRVADKSQHLFQKQELTVVLYNPLIDRLKALSRKQDEDKEIDKDEEPQPEEETEGEKADTKQTDKKPDVEEPRMVRVKGMKNVKNQETVDWYFENRNRAGGGEISERIQDDEDEDVYYISFKEIEAAKRVAERQTHTVDGTELQVSLYTPPPMYTNRALLKNLSPGLREDTLSLFLEAKANIILVSGSLTYHAEKDSVALMTAEQDIDFPMLEDVCRKYQLEKQTVTVQRVPVSNCILVTDLNTNVSEDTARFYFENKRRANGGPVEKVEMDGDACLVYFIDYQTVEDVLQQDHKLSGSTVTVRRYLSCIGKAEGTHEVRKVKIPEPIDIPDIDPRKVKYVKQSKVTQEAFKHQMEACHAFVLWQSHEGENKMQIVCTIQPDNRDARKLVKGWAEVAQGNFNAFMNKISAFDNEVVEELWDPVMQELKSISISNPDAVALIALKKDRKITVVGMTEDAKDLNGKIRKILKDAAEKAKEMKQQTKDIVTNLKLIETKMLLADKFPSQMESEFQNLKVKINQNKNEILFEGTVKDVQNAKLKMYMMKENYAVKSVQIQKKLQFKLYQSKQGKEYIVKKLKGLSVVGTWEVNEAQNVLIIMSTKENVDTVAKIIVESIQASSIGLGEANRSAIQTDKYDSLVSGFEKLYAGRVVVEKEELDRIVIVTTDDIFNEVLGDVKRYLKDNSIFLEDVGGFSSNINRLLKEHHRDELTEIAKGLRQFHVAIEFKTGKEISVTGTAEGVKQAKQKIEDLVKKVKKQQHTFEKPGLGGYIRTKGKDVITSIEKQSKVVISDNDDDDFDFDSNQDEDDSNEQDEGLQILASCKMYDIRKVSVGYGDLTDMAVDAIVNTADKTLSLAGGLGKAIVRKGGKLVERSCQSYIQATKQLGEGEVFVGHAGNLKMKNIVHVVGPVWEGGHQKEEEKLEICVFKALKQASVRAWKCMALPAISCGVYGYPLKRATAIIVKSVKNFFREEQDSPLEEVYLCDMSRDTAQAFVDALTCEMGKANVTVHTSSAPKPKPAQRRRPDFDPPQIPTLTAAEEELYDSPYQASGFARAPKPPKSDGIVTAGNITISVLKAEIAKHKVDVIVNTTSKNLDLNNGAVSKTILGAAGANIQAELKSKYPKGVDFGEVAETSGHKLKCANVVHGAVNNWDGPKAIKQLKLFITNCLQSATDGGYQSIAFPAIGTGNLGYPKPTVAKEMFATVVEFANRNRSSSLTTVHFVLYPKDSATIQAFEAEEQKILGRSTSYGTSRQYQSDSDSDSDLETLTDGDTEYGTSTKWEKNPDAIYFSPKMGLYKIMDPKHWLEDSEIDKASHIIKKFYPNIDGLFDICVVTVFQGSKVKQPFLQMIHSHRQHWVTTTNIGCNPGVVRIYDSMYRNIDRNCLQQLFGMITVDPRNGLEIELPTFQQQRNKADCGVYAIAAAFSLVQQSDPSSGEYDEKLIRAHLFQCLNSKSIAEFPKYRGQVKMQSKKTFRVYQCAICAVVLVKPRAVFCAMCKKSCHKPDPMRNAPCSTTVRELTVCNNCTHMAM